ncbi:MAG: replicative helicase [Clostridia bacterium]|jgi:replicative DNA helicase|nr:replicative helicase [Clostridia bacterium]
MNHGTIRPLPNNEKIEKALLGAMLIHTDSIQIIKDLLNPEDFHSQAHKELFIAIIQLEEAQKPIDLLTIFEAIKEYKDIITPEFLTQLMNATPSVSPANITQYAKTLKEYKHRRDAIKAAADLVSKAYEGDISQEAQKLEKVLSATPVELNGKPKRAGELINETLSIIENNQLNGGCVGAIASGFTDLDNMISGITKGELTIIAARPSMGKTAFMLNIAVNMTVKNNVVAAIFSMEMSRELIMQRLISQLTHINSMRLKSGQLKDDDWQEIARVATIIDRAPLYIDDITPQKASQIRAKCKDIENLQVIFIDYLDFIEHEGKAENRVHQISEVMKSLKVMARQLNIAVVLLVQLNRLCEQRVNKRPVLSDLRDSGAIEQDADVVMFIYRDEYYNSESCKKGVGEVIVAKNRNGQTGTIELAWLDQYTKYANKTQII